MMWLGFFFVIVLGFLALQITKNTGYHREPMQVIPGTEGEN